VSKNEAISGMKTPYILHNTALPTYRRRRK